MAIVKNLYDNKFISLYTEENITIWVKMALYHSIITNEEYDMVTDIIITKDKEKVYEATNINMVYNKDGLISIVNYIEKIILYVKTSKEDAYWQNIFLNKLLIYKSTIAMDLYYKRTLKEIEEQNRYNRNEEINQQIDQLKADIQKSYNNKGYLVVYDIFNLVILKMKDEKQNKQFINKQCGTSFKKFVLDSVENEKINTYEDIEYKAYKLNWNTSDIQLLNEILTS